MKVNIDGERLSIPCPGCGEKFNESIGRLKNNPVVPCPACGANVRFDPEELQRMTAGVQKAIDELRATLRKTFK